MKKLFTLLVGVLLAGNAFGQSKFKNVVVNGDMEGDVPAYTEAAAVTADAWNSFWVHEYPDNGDGATRYDGTATIVEGEGVNGSRCAKVVIRTEAQADAAGNKTLDQNNNFASWDSQFFIYATEPMPQGKEVRLTMWVKADKACSIETQAHYSPGDYNHYQLFGNIDVTTEWKQVVTDVITVSADQSQEGADPAKKFQSVAFNLATMKDGNVIYFDNIKLEMKDPKQSDPNAGWINFMRKGVFSEDPIDFVNYGSEEEPDMVKVSNFMIQVYDSELKGNILVKAPVVETGDPNFPKAVKVPTQNFTSTTETFQIPDLDADGKEQLDEDGNVLMKDSTSTTYYWADGSVIGNSAPARYSSQFFVSTLHKMKSNERYKFVFWAKADKPASIATQAHSLPTKYVSYNTFGSESDFALTTEWQKFELGEPKGQTVPSGANGCQTITFDCYCLQEENNYYFVFEECSFSEDNVTMADRTLGTPEDIKLPVDAGDEEKATTIDATPMLAAFEMDDFSFLNNGKDGVKLLDKKESDEEEGAFVDTFSAILPWTDGGFIGADGYFLDDSNSGINIRFDDESIDGKKININVWNNPDAGISFADGKTLETKLCVSMGGWYYIYNVTLGTEETLAGINGVKAVKADNGLIYNLSGQRVDASYKGLVIKNGQKFIQK